MFTRNWYKMLSVEMTRKSNVYYKNINGATSSKPVTADYFISRLCQDSNGICAPTLYKVRTDFTGNGGVVFGTGNEAPTIDDYKLSGELIPSGFSYVAAISSTIDDSGCTITAVYTITNTGTNSITIGEVALMCNLANYSGASYKAILERTVLDTPITIPAGGIGQVTYTIRLNYPTANDGTLPSGEEVGF